MCPARRHLTATLSALFHLHILTPRGAHTSSALSDDAVLDMSEGFRDSFKLALTGECVDLPLLVVRGAARAER